MRQEIKRLIELQDLDEMIRKLEATKEQLSREAAETLQKVETAKQALADHSDETKTFRRVLDGREAALKDIEAKIERLDGQLNMAKTNKEYSTLQHEIMGHKADASRIEDEILAMMEQAEAQQKELKELAKRADGEREEASKRKAVLENAIRDADERIAQIRKEREALSVEVPPNFLSPYERLRKKSVGGAMSACRNFICEKCRMSVTANTVNLLMAGERLVFCHSCGRILFLAEGEDIQGGAGAGRKEEW